MILSTLSRLLWSCSLACATVLAQGSDGSYWNEYPRPANTTQFRSIGTLAMIETPSEYHFYSGLHRRWTVHPVTAPLIHGVANAYCLFSDGNTVSAYCTRTGQVVSITVTGTPIVSIGTATSSWTAYVVDGNTVWGWSGFLGQFVPLTVANAPAVTLGSHVIRCDDGATLHAFSAFHGQWLPAPRGPANSPTTWRNGIVAKYSAPEEIACFSAYTNAWATLASPVPTNGLTPDVRDGYASLGDGTTRIWFSALHGDYVVSTHAATASTTFGPNCAIVLDGTNVTGYSPSQSSLTSIPVAASPIVTMATSSLGSHAVLDDGVSLQAFSGLTGTVAATPFYVPTTVTIGDTVAFATGPSGLNFAYSAVLGIWFTAPSTVATNTRTNFECVIRDVPGGFEAFSARTGTFATLSSTGTATFQSQGSLVCAVDANGLDTFDARYGTWEHRATGPNPTFATFRLIGVGQDGTNGYGYSLFTNEWHSIPLQGSFVGAAANSSIGYVQTSTHYYVFTGNGSLSTFARFPEFSRFAVLGLPLTRLQCGNPGAFVVGLFSIGADTALPTPFGTLRVDPATAVTATYGFVPPGGLLLTTLATPNVPALRGITLFTQDFLLQPNGSMNLSNGAAPILW